MKKFIPPYKCNTFLPGYLDGGNHDLPFNWTMLSGIENDAAKAVDRSINIPSEHKNTTSRTLEFTRKPSADYKQHRKWFVSSISRVCEDLLDKHVVKTEFPGGENRSACRLGLDDGTSVIATRRGEVGRTLLEHHVLTRLSSHTQRTPEVLGFNGAVLIQEDLQGTRLSEQILNASEDRYEQLMGKALDSLIDIHRASEQAGLDNIVPLMGCERGWIGNLIEQPSIIGSYLEIPCPYPPIPEMIDLLTIMRPRFIKWDARPGNAMVGEDGEVSWFDWEHCCARNRLDDMVWLLCDEIVPYHVEAENRVINSYLSSFADGYDLDMAHAYLRLFGILHMTVRLGGIISEKGKKPWMRVNDSGYSQPEDALLQAQRLCKKASDWTKESICPRAMSDWFMHISKRLEEM